MTIQEIAESNGFKFSHDCKVCNGKAQVYLHPHFPNVEMKIKKATGYVKIYRNGKQIAFATALNLQERLLQNNLIKTP